MKTRSERVNLRGGRWVCKFYPRVLSGSCGVRDGNERGKVSRDSG